MSNLNLTICPSCGGKEIKKVRKMVTGSRQGKHYSVPEVELYECSDCGERIYEPSAMRQIENATGPSKRKSPRKIA